MQDCPKLIFLVMACTSSTALAAQQGPFNGPAGSLPAGLSLSGATGGANDPTYVKPAAGIGPAMALHDPISGEVPDFTMSGLFPDYWDVLEIDAQSSGNATIHDVAESSNPPHPDLSGAQGWMELIISVDNDSLGTPGSLIANRVAQSSGRSTPGSDLFGFFQEGSTGVHSSLPGRTLLEVSAERFGFTNEEDMDAFDFGIGLLSLDPTHEPDSFFRFKNQFFFSLSPDCVVAVNARAALLGKPFAQPGGPADPASIYVVRRENGVWGTPEVYMEASVLELDPLMDNVDGLEVDPVRENVVFSTQPHPLRSQLRYLDFDSKASVPVRNLSDLGDGGGGLASHRLGSSEDTDDIDAVCIIDPKVVNKKVRLTPAFPGVQTLSLTGSPNLATLPVPDESQASTQLGIPTDAPTKFSNPVPIGLSVTRSWSPSGHQLHFQATGFGEAPPSAGVISFFIESPIGGVGGFSATTIPLGHQVGRSAAEFLVDWSVPTGSFEGPLECWCEFTSFTSPQPVRSWTTIIQVEG